MNSAKEVLRDAIELLSDEEASQVLEFTQHLQKKDDISSALGRLAIDPNFRVPKKSAFHVVKPAKDELFDEELPVKLPPLLRSYTVRGKIIRVEKAKPIELPLEESLLLEKDELNEDLPILPPPVKAYTVKGKIG
jgi:hypothetical protein